MNKGEYHVDSYVKIVLEDVLAYLNPKLCLKMAYYFSHDTPYVTHLLYSQSQQAGRLKWQTTWLPRVLSSI